MKKTVMEWLGEVKLFNKKIAKKEFELENTDLFYADTNIRYDKEKAKKYLEETNALYQSYKQLVANRNKIRQAILQFNACTFIEIGEMKITIAEALERLKNNENIIIDILEENINNMISKEAELKLVQENEVKEFEKMLYGSNKSIGNIAISEKLEERRKSYTPIIEEIFDLKKELEKEKEFKDEFDQKINTLINILNVQNTLEIELI